MKKPTRLVPSVGLRQLYRSRHGALRRRVKLTYLLAFTGLSLLFTTSELSASWRWAPLDVRLMQADAVVVGRIATVDRPRDTRQRFVAVGQLEVTEVLKGPAALKDLKLGWPEAGPDTPQMSNDDFRFSRGQEGVWILSKSDGLYWCRTPGHILPLDRVDQVRLMLKNLRSLPAGRPDHGIALSMAFQVNDGVARGAAGAVPVGRDVSSLDTSYTSANGNVVLHAWITNVSDAPVALLASAGANMLTITMTGSDGKSIDLLSGVPSSVADKPQVAAPQLLAAGESFSVLEHSFRARVPGNFTITAVYSSTMLDGVASAQRWQGSSGASINLTIPTPRVPEAIAGIRLLPGYKLEAHLPGDDGYARGKIAAPGKLEINYSQDRFPEELVSGSQFRDNIAMMKNVYAGPVFQWYKQQTIGGEIVHVALTSTEHERRFGGTMRKLMASFRQRGLNLSASVANDEEIAEALAMMLSVITVPNPREGQ